MTLATRTRDRGLGPWKTHASLVDAGPAVEDVFSVEQLVEDGRVGGAGRLSGRCAPGVGVRKNHFMTSAVLQVRIPPRHCDAQGVMHAARPYEYFEDAFLAWLDQECGGYESLRAGGDDFVIVQTQCRYIAPARLGDRIDLAVRPVSVGKRSSFTIEVEMARDGHVLTRCSVTYVTVRDGRSSPIPGPLRQAMRANG